MFVDELLWVEQGLVVGIVVVVVQWFLGGVGGDVGYCLQVGLYLFVEVGQVFLVEEVVGEDCVFCWCVILVVVDRYVDQQGWQVVDQQQFVQVVVGVFVKVQCVEVDGVLLQCFEQGLVVC